MTRSQRARADTDGLKSWRTDLVGAVVGAAILIAIGAVFGWPDKALAVLLGLAAFAVGLGVAVVAEYGVNLLLAGGRNTRDELEKAQNELQRLHANQQAPPQLSFGKAIIPKQSQLITLPTIPGPPVELARGRVIRVPVLNARGAGEAKQVHARLRFTTGRGEADSMFVPAATQGEWQGDGPEPELEITLAGNGRPRLLDVVVVLEGEYPHAYEWTTGSRYAGLNGYAIKATPFEVEIEVMGSGANDAPYLHDTLQIECAPKHLIRADWQSRDLNEGTNWVAWQYN